MLKQLLGSIAHCKFDKILINEINIIVVDNDIAKTAEEVITNLNLGKYFLNRIHYYDYPSKGLANVRNELLGKALKFNPDFIIFIDDDEFVTENWINELVKTIIFNNADAARGPVIAKIEYPVSKYIATLFERENYENNAQISTWTTGNLILRRTSLERHKIWFDKRFNSVGSEDTYFGFQMASKGATIHWAANAVVYEIIPKKRTTIKWFIRRKYRGANMYMFILKLEKSYLNILKKIIVSVLYIIIGSFSFILILMPVKIKYWGILKLSEGIGGLTGLFNIQYQEYK
jgi:GT2 family glycosyltransferase